MKQAKVFCPAGISSFFQTVTSASPAQSDDALCQIGARGAGFIIEHGVTTTVSLETASDMRIDVTINGIAAPDAKVTREVCKLLLKAQDQFFHISIDHLVDVPIGAGYGASAAGAVSTAMALSKTLDKSLTLNQIGQFAHIAEIRCATGLGSVSGVLRGGAILILEPGAPGYDRVDWLPIDPALRIVTASFAPIPKKDIIFSKQALRSANREAQQVLDQILTNPDPALFMELCLRFARKAGFLSKRLSYVIEKVLMAGALGATQNMLGEAFHALVDVSEISSVLKVLTDFFPRKEILVSEISCCGPRYS